ncbi:diguanylate cyclase domain-containing protein [Rhodococcoides corynebacterioides]|uniref:GGDEF domain-containing protein n=1 Tax=Rhodococcoides corynebacterioides TaxID=53972 RepID=UPI003AE4FC7A
MSALRDWWSATPDYEWIRDYHRAHPLLRRAPYVTASGCFLIAIMAIVLVFSPVADEATTQLLVAAASAVGAGCWWARGRFPSRRASLAFIVYAGIAIPVGILSTPPSTISLYAVALMVTVGNYVTAMHDARVFVAQEAWSLVVAIVVFVRVLTADVAPVQEVVATFVLVLGLLFTASTLNHVFLTALRNDASRALFDQLTGLRNRRGLHTAVEALMRDHRPAHLSVLCLDLDAFKSVNDRFGHAVGDEVLRATAARIDQLSPPGSVSARLGGEEFAVVVPGDDARAFARSLLTGIHRPDDRAPVTASVGVAVEDVTEWEGLCPRMLGRLLDRADIAMYRAKRDGGNSVVVAAASEADGPL